MFSQFRDFLDVLARAFEKFRIDFTSIDKKNGAERFKKDPSVSPLLLVVMVFTDYVKGRMLLSPCQSPFIGSQSCQRNTCLSLRTVDQHSHRASSHCASPPYRSAPTDNRMDVPCGRDSGEGHLRNFSNEEDGAYRPLEG